jgi:beta-lactamase class A
MIKRETITRILVALCALLLIGNIGWVAVMRKKQDSSVSPATASQQKQFSLLSVDVLADNPNDILINFVPLRKSLTQKFAGIDARQSFYFEYLPDGTSIRIGADQQLTAASLIKVPLVMNLYKAAELKRVDLDKPMAITQAELDNAYGDLWQRGPGFMLTLRQAAKYATQQSDNTATHFIFDHMQNILSYDEQSLARLDVDQNTTEGQAVITARAYSSVMKSLYFSSYLQKQDSQEILSYLTHSAETERLTKQLPGSVLVAHKNGVYNTNENWAESDCGVVYVPRRPYILCIMVGLPQDQANAFIAQVSKEVYDFVVSQK